MKRSVIFIILVLFTCTVVGLFNVSYKVRNLKKDLVEVHRQLATDKAVIHILKAEWAYLNEPARIKKLSDRYLNLEYIKVAQLKDKSEIKTVYLADVRERSGKSTRPTLRPIPSGYNR